MRKPALLLLIGLLALAAAGCGSDDDEAADTGAATTAGAAATGSADACAPESLELINDGMLTVGTDNPAFPPWFDGGTPEGSDWEINDPSTGKGFESAVAYAVAEKLGFAKDDVQWIVVPFNNSFRPGPKDFDFDINQISVTDERDMAVDFSDSYYDVNQALVALNGTPLADATSVADLKDAQLGAQVGTTSLAYIEDTIQPDKEPRVYDTSNDVVAALNLPRPRMEPALPMLSIEPVLPMQRMLPELPMLNTDPTLPMLRMEPALRMLPTLRKLMILCGLRTLSRAAPALRA